MKLTSACVHALRALTYLARHDGDGPVASHTIAEAEGLSEGFLLKVLKPLVVAGVLHSVKGTHGGYRLARPARDITLLEVVEAVEGPLRGRADAVGKEGAPARLDARLQGVCDDVTAGVRRHLGRVSVADLAG